MRLLVRLSFNGRGFYGTQKQEDDPTIQGVFEAALAQLYSVPVKVTICSRLDRYVNAFDFVLTFDVPDSRVSQDYLGYYLKRTLGRDIVIKQIREVPEAFSARFDCDYKSYVYTLQNSAYPNPLLNVITYVPAHLLSVDKLSEALSLFVGPHDFRYFATPEGEEKTAIDVRSIEVSQLGDLVFLRFVAKSFLRYQVRFMVGASLRYATGKVSLSKIATLLTGKEVSYLKLKAEPQALTLEAIHYPSLEGEKEPPKGIPCFFNPGAELYNS